MVDDLSDALQYARYCQFQAKNAIARYNNHVEKGNCVVEERLSGMVTPGTAQLATLKRRVDQLTADNGALKFEKARLTEELQQKALDLNSLNQRVAEAEEKLQRTRSTSPNAELVARINRLEQENQKLKQPKAANGLKAEQQAATQNNL
jgi:chromosome segregation ATPase